MGIIDILKKGLGQISYGDHYIRFTDNEWEVERIPIGKLNRREILYYGKSQAKATGVFLIAIGHESVAKQAKPETIGQE